MICFASWISIEFKRYLIKEIQETPHNFLFQPHKFDVINKSKSVDLM